MSENIQISFEACSEAGPDSSKAFKCHKPPMMSVPV